MRYTMIITAVFCKVGIAHQYLKCLSHRLLMAMPNARCFKPGNPSNALAPLRFVVYSYENRCKTHIWRCLWWLWWLSLAPCPHPYRCKVGYFTEQELLFTFQAAQQRGAGLKPAPTSSDILRPTDAATGFKL
jgi:hypothetical protein